MLSKSQDDSTLLCTLTDEQIVVSRQDIAPDNPTFDRDILPVHTNIKAGPFVYYEGDEDDNDGADSGTGDWD